MTLHLLVRKTLSSFIYTKKLIFPPRGITVLTYHRINNENKPGNLDTPIITFAEQLKYLIENKYSTINLSNFLELLNNKNTNLKNSKKILLTFDDGWKDNYINAFPILKKYSLKGIIFIVTNKIEKLKDYLKYMQIKEMSRYGIEFGAHTRNHPNLTKISLDIAKNEIEKSKQDLEELLQLPVNSFCYPSGMYNQKIIEIVKRCGYKCAFTVKPGKNDFFTNKFELKRTEINGIDTHFDFKKKLSGGYDWLHKIVQSDFYQTKIQ